MSRGLVLPLLVLCGGSAFADIPGWFREAATAAHPAYPAQTKGVALFYEETVRVEPTGKQTSQVRKAIKILNKEGKGEAIGAITYDAKGSRVRDFKAWLIYPTGKTKEYGKKDFVEGSSQPDFMMYSTRRFYSINAAADVDPGTIFGFEATLEEDTVFSQFLWPFQDDLPHMLSRFQLTVPPGWKAEAKAYNGVSAEPQVSGSTYTWESRKLSPIEREPSAPRLYSMLPRIAVSMLPPEGSAAPGGPIASFRTWKDVARWKYDLIDPQSQLSAAIEAKSAELSAGKTNVLDRIRGMAEHVQQIRYVAISTNTARGGGYVPHKADEVLRLAYGDCKDKSNLLRTMLKTQQIASYPIAIYSGDPRFTMADFPSPHQFNHAILAIRVPDDVQMPAAFTHPTLGRLLLFDPTDTNVPFGHLPDHEQNAFALLSMNADAGENAYLIKTPQTKPADNHTQREWTMNLDAEGGVQGVLVETSIGQSAFDEREQARRLSKEAYKKMLDGFLSRTMTGAVIDGMESAYDEEKKSFRLELRFHTASYAKIMNGRLWMLRSMPATYLQAPNVNKNQREQPLVLQPSSFSEHVKWQLPERLNLDELPESDRLSSPVAVFESSWKQSGREIEARRRLETQSAVIPAESYKSTREFFLRFHGAGEAPIVLVAK